MVTGIFSIKDHAKIELSPFEMHRFLFSDSPVH